MARVWLRMLLRVRVELRAGTGLHPNQFNAWHRELPATADKAADAGAAPLGFVRVVVYEGADHPPYVAEPKRFAAELAGFARGH